MSSGVSSLRGVRARVRRGLHAGLFAVALVSAPVATTWGTARAQSTYGGSSYGTQTYSTGDDAGAEVLPPNTGFQAVMNAAVAQPVLFWGGVVAVVGALVGSVFVHRASIKRKQENS